MAIGFPVTTVYYCYTVQNDKAHMVLFEAVQNFA